jgi:dTDP-4-dehydrorhamnose reductase
MTARILLFGRTGQVGCALLEAHWPAGAAITALDRTAAEFTRPETLGPLVAAHRPDIVVIAAAYTAVDRAESEEELAMLVNAEAPGAIAAAAAAVGAPVVHLSTDYVFEGGKAGPYVEEDDARPINAYGRSKLAGEKRVRDANPRHLIFRTSWVYGPHGTNFLRTMLALAGTRDVVRVVADQTGCPTSARDLAEAIARISPRLLAPVPPPWGIYHLAGASATTWHGLADTIFAALNSRGLPRPRNIAIASDARVGAAPRPSNSSLSSEHFRSAFGFGLPGFEVTLPAVLDEVLETT